MELLNGDQTVKPIKTNSWKLTLICTDWTNLYQTVSVSVSWPQSKTGKLKKKLNNLEK